MSLLFESNFSLQTVNADQNIGNFAEQHSPNINMIDDFSPKLSKYGRPRRYSKQLLYFTLH